MKNIKKITKKRGEEAEDKLPEKKRYKKILPVLLSFFVGFLLNFVIISVYFFWMAKYSESPAKKMSSEKSINLPPSAPVPMPPPAFDPALAPKVVSSGATYAFSGTVVGVEGNTITVDMFSCGEGHKTYKMLVTKNTTMIKREKEQENPASLDDIKENYNVAVEAFEDIKSKDNLEAKKIMIMTAPKIQL